MISAAAPGVMRAASSGEKGTVSVMAVRSVISAMGVPALTKSPLWRYSVVTVPEASARTVRSAQAEAAWS